MSKNTEKVSIVLGACKDDFTLMYYTIEMERGLVSGPGPTNLVRPPLPLEAAQTKPPKKRKWQALNDVVCESLVGRSSDKPKARVGGRAAKDPKQGKTSASEALAAFGSFRFLLQDSIDKKGQVVV